MDAHLDGLVLLHRLIRHAVASLLELGDELVVRELLDDAPGDLLADLAELALGVVAAAGAHGAAAAVVHPELDRHAALADTELLATGQRLGNHLAVGHLGLDAVGADAD